MYQTTQPIALAKTQSCRCNFALCAQQAFKMTSILLSYFSFHALTQGKVSFVGLPLGGLPLGGGPEPIFDVKDDI